MTQEEAAALKPGDAVEVNVGKEGWAPATVVSQLGAWTGCVRVRRNGKTRGNVGYPPRQALVCYLRPCPHLPPLPANVYADWLDEQGFSEAARALREHFPLDAGSP